MMSVTINGKSHQLNDSTELQVLLRERGWTTQFFAIAYNGIVLEEKDYPQVVLSDGDTLDIVRPVGGG